MPSLNRSPVKFAAMLKTTILFLGLLALVRSQSTPVSQCIYHGGSLPINTYIENCPSTPCQLAQGTDVVLHIVFRAPYTMRTMTTLAHAYILGPIGINHDLGPEAVTCNFLTNTYCPVLGDEVIQYTLSMHIESWFPIGTQVTIEFRIADEGSTPVVCLRVPVAITPPLSSGQLAGLASNRTLVVNSGSN